ncbi:MAG: TetR/AcrR family transcriptional regulator [Solobacterium sp.]|nr:TetR/AcrR family transcriptional regulator [Solobacterium sp.]
MPPRVKFQQEEIVNAALNVARKKGIEAVTAREVAAELHVSSRPIFTYYGSMDQLRRDVYDLAKEKYRTCIETGLTEKIPFLGVGKQYIRFAKEEPELYKLLFLTKPDGAAGGAMEVLRFSQDLVRDSIMRIYKMDAHTADCYFRDMWLIAFSFATLIVTDDCPYTEEQMNAVFSEMSLAVCKAFKEIPGMPYGNYSKDEIFRDLIENE